MKKNIFLLLIIVSLVSFLPFVAHGKDLKDVLTSFKDKLIALGAILATLAFIIAGIMFLLATVDPSKMNAAKLALLAAVIGILIIALAPFAYTFVTNIFGLP